jgi:hypothetical protein
MSASFQNFDELRTLLDALCEETIDADGARRLAELVLSHPEAERFYIQYVSLHADLSRQFGGHAVTVALPRPEPVAEKSRRGLSKFSRWAIAVSALAAGVVLALLLRSGTESAPRRAEPTDNTVAVLLQAPGATWEEGTITPRAGAPLPPCRLNLKSGLAHIEFYSGATVILEGPAELDLVSANAAYCTRGKLRATVPPQAQGFTVTTPKLELVDRGTEFGLEVGADDKTEVHVFQGKVELHDASASQHAVGHKELTTGQAVHLDGPGTVRALRSDPEAFRTVKDLEARLAEEIRRRHRDWLAASEALRQEPSLLVYYTFQNEPADSRTLLNQSIPYVEASPGAIIGGRWGTGRWPGKKGLEFKQLSDRVRFHVHGNFDSITLMAWVRVDALPNENNSLMMTDAWKPGGIHWQIGNDGKLILGVKRPTGYTGGHYHARDVFTPKRFGQWTHLAVVYDADERLVSHYVDGQVVARLPLLFDVPLHIGDAEIGNWNPATSRNKSPIRYLSGCMDEFVMCGRALSDAEIERHYSEGRPAS